jgi:peptide-methionine (S)-S-oxide reductase
MRGIILSIIMSSLWLSACLQPTSKISDMNTDMNINANNSNLQTATFGAGCFWCVEAVFQELKGVQDVQSGFSGGQVKNPAYREVVNGTTGHAEVCNIIFDPSIIGYDELLEVFWTTHDPTTLNRQGNDVGTQYRSAIFYHDDNQKLLAEKSKNEIAPQIWDEAIVTEITAFDAFYPADEYHDDYFKLNPNQGYCRVVIAPKVAKFKKKFEHKLKD